MYNRFLVTFNIVLCVLSLLVVGFLAFSRIDWSAPPPAAAVNTPAPTDDSTLVSFDPMAPRPSPTPRPTEAPLPTSEPAPAATAAPTSQGIENAPETVPTTTLEATSAPTPTESQQAGFVEHTVQRGEALSTLAKQYGVSVRDILAFNNLANPNSLKVGTVIRIPQVPAPAAQ